MTWADFIAEDFGAKVLQGRKLPQKLTLQQLCDEYQVSLTPVRKAVKELVKRGIILKTQTGRLLINQTKIKGRGKKKKVKSPKPPKDFFEVIARGLVLKSLEGSAFFLREELIAEKYGISRTVIHRIFNRLAGSGLIEHLPRRGWRLRPFNREDLSAFLQVREVLELKALDLARNRLEAKVLQKILDGNVAATNGKRIKVDNSLHSYIVEKSQNRYISDFFEHYGRYYEILFACEDMDKQSADLAAKQHCKILSALLAKKWIEARAALIEHIHTNHVVLQSEPQIILKLAKRKRKYSLT